MRSSFVLRARILSAFFVLFALLLIGRLYFVQVVRGEQYQRDAMGQYVEASSGESENRGAIYFTTKDGVLVAAAVMQTGWKVAITPKLIDDPERTYEILSARTNVDRERFFRSAAKLDDPYEEVAFRVSDVEARIIREKRLPGVLLVQDRWRVYPGGELAANVLGFVGYLGDTRQGVYGLERKWQDTLAFRSGGLYVNPFAEIFANVGALLTSDPAEAEGSIITSIEPTVQQKFEETLDRVMERYAPRLAGGIVMDPDSGEVIAMAVRPTYDPNTFNMVEDSSVFTNPLVEGRYEMGSIVKPLTVAAGIDSGAITPDTHYEDTGCVTRSGKRVCNYDFKARGWTDMQQVLSQSLNTGVTFVADTMGHEAFTRYMESFGLGWKTGIDLPGEIAGDISALGKGHGSAVDYAAASFGQGIATTPIQMTRALAALANEGVLPQPHLVTGVRYESGIVRSIRPEVGPEVLKPETVTAVSRMLTEVFDEALLGGELKRERYSIAAKTGTAQIAIPGGGGYYTDRYLHSFFGYFPAYEPEFIVFLFTVEPKGAEYASATLAQPFLDTADFLINYYDIPPDR